MITYVKNIMFCKFKLEFTETFSIARESVDSSEIVILQLVDEYGNIGIGTAAPDEEVTGETVSQILEIFKKKLKLEIFNSPIAHWYKYHEKIQHVFERFPSAQSAVEEALLNLFALQNKIPLTSVFGGYRDRAPTMVTISMNTREKVVTDVKKRINDGFKILKLKAGRNAEDDIATIRAVAQTEEFVSNNKLKLIVDINGAYSYNEAKKYLTAIKDLQVELIEQPVAATDLRSLEKLHHEFSIPIVADESVLTYEDAFMLMKNDIVSGVNIKLMKCGGPINFLKIFYLSRLFNKICMIGCMYESNISMTTGASLVLALPVDFVDLDSGHLDFQNDPAIGGALVRNGEISIPEKLALNF